MTNSPEAGWLEKAETGNPLENDLETIDSGQFVESYSPNKINGDFYGQHIISVEQFCREDLEELFGATINLKRRMESGDRGVTEIARGQILALLFQESSTRTDMSFQAAMRRLGGSVIVPSNGLQFSSVYKGEDLPDTVRAAGCYADGVVLRHSEVGASYLAAHYLDLLEQKIGRRSVVISAGDGIGEHPTQALLDLFTILESKESVNNLSISLVGDLKHGRTVHSLAKLLAVYKPEGSQVNFVAPESLSIPADIISKLEANHVAVVETTRLADVLAESDVIYWTRIQQERFEDPADYERLKDDFVMRQEVLTKSQPTAVLMHPLPRKHEMGGWQEHDRLDQDRRSIYFRQMENGMLIRMALLAKVLTQTHL